MKEKRMQSLDCRRASFLVNRTNRSYPQGSCCGPGLWNILLNQLLVQEEDRTDGVQIYTFADDLMLKVSGQNANEISRKANTVLERISNWGNARGLQFNEKKTQATFIRHGRLLDSPLTRMNGQVIRISDSIRYLGVEIDKMLRWRKHVSNACQKTSKRLNMCLQIAAKNWGLQPILRERLYKAVFLPSLLYASEVWNDTLRWKGAVKELKSLQRTLLIWLTSACSTTSYAQTLMLVKAKPIEMLVRHSEMFCKAKKVSAEAFSNAEAEAEVKTYWMNQREGKLIGRIDTQKCVARLDLISFSSVRFLTGHGQFNRYLCDIGVADSPLCPYCDLVDTPDHIIYECQEYEELRKRYLDRNQVMQCRDGTAVKLNSKETADFVAFYDHAWRKRDRHRRFNDLH